jgi:hypothetical protein
MSEEYKISLQMEQLSQPKKFSTYGGYCLRTKTLGGHCTGLMTVISDEVEDAHKDPSVWKNWSCGLLLSKHHSLSVSATVSNPHDSNYSRNQFALRGRAHRGT